MKLASAALGITFLILCSVIGIITGFGMMIYDIFVSHTGLGQDFMIFAISTTMFLTTVVAYIATKILARTDALTEVIIKYFQNEMLKEAKQHMPSGNPFSPLMNLFQGQGFPGPGTVSISSMDENGNIIPLGEKTFSSHEELIKHRNEILQKHFGSVNKDLKDMSIEELHIEEKKAVAAQDFELAASIVNLIEEKKQNLK